MHYRKHFTIDRKLKGPDHSFALEPDEFKEMVGAIRYEKSLGSVLKVPSEEELYLIGREVL